MPGICEKGSETLLQITEPIAGSPFRESPPKKKILLKVKNTKFWNSKA